MAALVAADFVRVNSSTTGTGTYTLGSTVPGYQSFAAIGDTNTCYYSATDGVGWEVGYGTYTAAGTTLARTAIISSSNANAAVNWTTPITIAAVPIAETLFQRQVISAAYTLTSQTAAQKLLNASANGAVTLPVGTYRFRCAFSLTAISATSGTFGFALGGTATFTQSWTALANRAASLAGSGNATMGFSYNTAANTSLTVSNTNTVGQAGIDGLIRVTVAGTVIPQVSLTIAAAAIVGVNSFFECERIGSATETLVGANWS